VDWNPKAVQKVIDRCGYVWAGIKVDGFRCLIRLGNELGSVSITTREGIEIQALHSFHDRLYRELMSTLLEPYDVNLCLDAEVHIRGMDFDTMSGLLRAHAPLPEDAAVQFVVFDMVYTAEMLQQKPSGRVLHNRLPTSNLLPVWTTDRLVCGEGRVRCTSLAEVETMYAAARDRGFEGLVVKAPDIPYKSGKVSGWWKYKPSITVDGKVVGYVWGETGKANDGKVVGFQVKLENGETVNATGLTKFDMEKYTSHNLDCIGRYCEVSAMEPTASGKLRHPKFKRWRDLDYAPGVKA
jgi:ATP-dependent DNA ligase